MATRAQILANRRNARRSTGPRTPAGKAAAARNATRHNLSARQDIINAESRPDFEQHRYALLAEIAPLGPTESILADRIISLSWRLKRAAGIQNQTIDALNAKNASDPLARIAQSLVFRRPLAPLPPNSDSADENLALGRMAIKDFANARILDRLLMYERRIEHSLFKTLLELQRLRLLRQLSPPGDPPEEADYPLLRAKYELPTDDPKNSRQID